MEVDLLTRSGLNMVQNILSDEDEGDLVSLIMTQYDKKKYGINNEEYEDKD